MTKRKLLLAALAFSSIGIAPLASAASIYVDIAPPAPRYEVVPAPRAGYVWQEGYWDWEHGRHHWHKGYWVKERHGMYWHPSRWEEREGRYHFVQGRWDRERYAASRYGDRDHDGVPNRYDHDRDGDGVPNRADRAPDNPYRH